MRQACPQAASRHPGRSMSSRNGASRHPNGQGTYLRLPSETCRPRLILVAPLLPIACREHHNIPRRVVVIVASPSSPGKTPCCAALRMRRTSSARPKDSKAPRDTSTRRRTIQRDLRFRAPTPAAKWPACPELLETDTRMPPEVRISGPCRQPSSAQSSLRNSDAAKNSDARSATSIATGSSKLATSGPTE